MGGWLGKAVGGTLGQPWEGSRGPLNLSYYDPVPKQMEPNDDLDLQILWACKLAAEWNGVVSRENFARAWVDNIAFPYDEYGVAIRNLKLDIPAPYSGSYDNWFRDGLGAAIRSELWAFLAPGNPELAARYAYEDACVDHTGDGIYAAQFLAVLESLAFEQSDIPELIDRALEFIPQDSALYRGIADTVGWCRVSSDFSTVRQQIMDKYGSANFTDVKMNLPFMAAALLLGNGDFEKSVCLAANFGEDADCTGASVGAILGIIAPSSIPAKWLAPIGNQLLISPEITGIAPPGTLEEFTDLIIGLRDKVRLEQPVEKAVDLERFQIPCRHYVLPKWFAADFRKFAPETEAPADEQKRMLPGNLITVDFSGHPANALQMFEIKFRIDRKRKIRVLVNTPANMRVWIDGNYAFGRESGQMVPAFHRAPLNQSCDLTPEAGEHTLLIGCAAAGEHMQSAELLFGIADEKNQWITDAFYKA